MNQSELLRRKRIQTVSNSINKLPSTIGSNQYTELKSFSVSSISNTPQLYNKLMPPNTIYVYDTFIVPPCDSTDYFCDTSNRTNKKPLKTSMFQTPLWTTPTPTYSNVQHKVKKQICAECPF